MPLGTGSRLGTHEIIGLLGAGGMGEVYRALDTKLNRQVAIKVLPEAYASDADRVSRFHREAQAVAALNHPNIAAIYDLAESDPSTGSGQAAIKYLALELIEGDTLADRLRRVSPDGKFVAFDSEDETESIVWIYELSGASAMRRLTFEGKNRSPVWSADGLRVAFQSDRDGDLAVFQQPADGSGTAERLTRPEAGTSHEPQSWSPDGAHLMFGAQKDGQWTLWTLAMKDRTTAPFGAVRSVERAEGVFSPNGRWVAYQASERAGGRQVFVQPFPTTGAKFLVGTGGQPYWSPNGNDLLLNAGASSAIVVPVTTTPRVAFGQPVDFPRRGRNDGDPAIRRRNVDSMPDAQHVVGVASGDVGGATDYSAITVVLNWFDEVRQKAPRR